MNIEHIPPGQRGDCRGGYAFRWVDAPKPWVGYIWIGDEDADTPEAAHAQACLIARGVVDSPWLQGLDVGSRLDGAEVDVISFDGRKIHLDDGRWLDEQQIEVLVESECSRGRR